MTPTELSLRELRNRGYRVAKVEHWNPFAKIRQDLFGVIDLIALGDNEVVGIQATSYSNVSSRVEKIVHAEATPDLRKAGVRLLVHGWRKVKGKWVCRQVDLS